MDKRDGYTVVESPFKDALDSCIRGIRDEVSSLHDADDRRAVENALYFSVTKRIGVIDYNGEPLDYLSGLLSDIYDAKSEFEQVCYHNLNATKAFSTIMGIIMVLLSSQVDIS